MPKLLPQQYAKILYKLTQDLSNTELDSTIRIFLGFLKKEQSFKKIGYIISYFEKYSKEQQGIASIKITTARPLHEDVTLAVAKVFGEMTEFETHIDKDIIGGIIIRTKNTILDGSIKTQLEKLKQEMM